MHKKITILALLFTTLILVACGPKVSNKEYYSDIVISKYYEALTMNNSVIELYNNGNDEIKLNNLTLDIYANGAATRDYSIKLEGKIEPKGYYLIARPDAKAEILEIADMTTNDLLFNGNDMVALVTDDEILDVVGHYLSSADFGKDATLIRMPDRMEQNSVYDEGDFIVYQPEVFEYLKNDNFPVQTMEQLLDGPQFNESLFDKPFLSATDPTIGGGGLLKVTLVSIADGDTASFQRSDNNEIIRVRYLYVDTPEVNGTHTTVQPWGMQASNFNKQYLLANTSEKEIYLQTIEGLSTVDTFGRFLALVWVDGVLSNHVIVRNGLSQVSKDFSIHSMSAAYNQVPYISYLLAAQANAADKNLGVMGGVDPCWDYGRGELISGGCSHYPNDQDWKN